MQTDKIKKIISTSFITNQDLLECIRNKSFKMSRESSKELKPKVNLIKKKSFQNISKQNSSFFANRNNNASCILDTYPSNEGKIDKVIYLLQDCLEQLPEGMQKMRHKLKKSLQTIRSVREQKLQSEVNNKLFESQKENAMLKRIEDQFREKIALQKECDYLRDQVKLLETKLIKASEKHAIRLPRKNLQKQDTNLHQIIISQSQLINRQCEQHKEESIDFRNMMKVQALEIEKLLRSGSRPNYFSNESI